MIPKKLHVPASRIDEETWTKVSLASLHYKDAVDYLTWLRNNTKGRYARTLSSFWFENEKDAFAFQIKFGSK